MDAGQVVEGTTTSILGQLIPPPYKKCTHVPIHDARGDFDNLVREIVGRIPRINFKEWKRQWNLSKAEIKRMVKATLEKLEECKVVRTARDGKWILNIERFQRWMKGSAKTARRRAVKAAASPPPTYVNQPRSLTAVH